MEGPFGIRRRNRPAINITPLIDVMFLLLIFFMVSSTFREYLGIDIALPRAATATEHAKTPWEISVKADGTVYFAGRPATRRELRAELAALLEDDPEASLVLRADEGTPFQDVITVIDIVRDVGGARLIIPTRTTAEAETTNTQDR